MSKTSRRLLGLVYAPLRQWRGLDTISPQDLVVDNIISSPESSSADLEKVNRGRLDDLGLGFEEGQVVVVSLDGTPGGESNDLSICNVFCNPSKDFALFLLDLYL